MCQGASGAEGTAATKKEKRKYVPHAPGRIHLYSFYLHSLVRCVIFTLPFADISLEEFHSVALLGYDTDQPTPPPHQNL